MHNLIMSNEKFTPTMVGADLWSPAVVGAFFYNNIPIECNKLNYREVFRDF